MADLLLNPAILTTLANNQEAAAKNAEAAANDLNGIAVDCQVSHGAVPGCAMASNGLVTLEGIRQAACNELVNGSKNLAAKLRTARQAYEGVDGELADNLNKQMLDR
jgi:hypothetical protein